MKNKCRNLSGMVLFSLGIMPKKSRLEKEKTKGISSKARCISVDGEPMDIIVSEVFVSKNGKSVKYLLPISEIRGSTEVMRHRCHKMIDECFDAFENGLI